MISIKHDLARSCFHDPARLCLMLYTPSFRNIREKLKILEFWTFRKFWKVMEKGNEWSVVTLAEHIRPMWLMLEPAWSLQTVFYISWYVAVDYLALVFFWNDDCIVAGWFLLSRLVATATGSTQAKCSHTVACYSAWAPARYFDPWWRKKVAPTNVHGILSTYNWLLALVSSKPGWPGTGEEDRETGAGRSFIVTGGAGRILRQITEGSLRQKHYEVLNKSRCMVI